MTTGTSAETRWLTASEDHLWRSWLTVNALVLAALHRDLHAASGLSMTDLDTLVRLKDSPEGRLRVSELARVLQWERSRVSHQIRRMEQRGLLVRRECPEDARGAFVAITDAGRCAIDRAAPSHVAGVRRLLFDVLDDSDQSSLARILDSLAAPHEACPQ